MENNLVSIITPLYNSEKYIGKTIQSVVNQSYKNFEMIIVDDCSGDKGVEIAESFSENDERIKLIKNEKNLGAALTRNVGLKEAKGRFIAFLDSDDLWEDTKLDKQVNFMLENNCPISFTSYELINELGGRLNHIISSVEKLTLTDYLKNTIIGCSTAMIDKSMTGEFEFLNIPTRQDTHLWITLLKKGISAYGIKEVLVKYRVHGGSISSNKVNAAKQVWNLYYNIEKFGFFKSSYYFVHYAFNAVKKRIFSGK